MQLAISFRTGFFAGLILAIAIGLYLFLLWQPDEQVRLHTQHLFAKIEKRNWNGVADSLAENYRDQWGDDRALLLERLRLIAASVGNLKIGTENELTIAANGTGDWRAKIQITADPGEVTTLISERVNSLNTPFELEWRRQSTKPWDWQLVSAKNPTLEIPTGFY